MSSLFAALPRLEEETRRAREEETRRIREERQSEIQAFSNAVAQVGSFPVHAIVKFLRTRGTMTDFAPLQEIAHLQWAQFEGTVTVGLMQEPNAGGFHTMGDLECDFEGLPGAAHVVPPVSCLVLREFGRFQHDETLIDGFHELGLTQEDLTPTAQRNNMFWGDSSPTTVACFCHLATIDASIPFSNLQGLHLEGNVVLQQLTMQSMMLREISISLNSKTESSSPRFEVAQRLQRGWTWAGWRLLLESVRIQLVRIV